MLSKLFRRRAKIILYSVFGVLKKIPKASEKFLSAGKKKSRAFAGKFTA